MKISQNYEMTNNKIDRGTLTRTIDNFIFTIIDIFPVVNYFSKYVHMFSFVESSGYVN